jgi:hypothetical protein
MTISATPIPTRVFELEEGLIMLIGATSAAALVEIGAVEAADGRVIVHAMLARAKFLT